MWIAWSSGNVLGGRYEGGDFDLDLGAFIDQARDVEQRRGREISPQCLAPDGADAGSGGCIFAAAGQKPGEPDDVLGPGAGLRKQLDDPAQRRSDLPGHVGLIVTLLVTAGLAGKHDPSAGAIERDAVRKAARL